MPRTIDTRKISAFSEVSAAFAMAWRTASPASVSAASPISSLPFGKWK